MTKATEDLLASLHGELAKAMADKLRDGTATASDLNVIRQFLKDNGVNADGVRDPEIVSLTDSLPDDLDNVIPMYGG